MSDGHSSIRVTIPQGWVSIEGTDIRKHRDQPNEVTFELYSADINVYPDACATEDRGPRTGPTADDLLAALRAQQNSDVSEPAEITIGGHPGLRLEVSVPEGLDVAATLRPCDLVRRRRRLPPRCAAGLRHARIHRRDVVGPDRLQNGKGARGDSRRPGRAPGHPRLDPGRACSSSRPRQPTGGVAPPPVPGIALASIQDERGGQPQHDSVA